LVLSTDDPIDGTKNFVGGVPVWASPVVGFWVSTVAELDTTNLQTQE
jgi:hypothetical protein